MPRSCIYELWDAFNDIAEGFGLTYPEFREILKVALLEYLNISEQALNLDAEKVFHTFDDDQVCLSDDNALFQFDNWTWLSLE